MRNVILTMLAICLTAAAANAGTVALWNFDDKAIGELADSGGRLVDSTGNGYDVFIDDASVPVFDDPAPFYSDSGAALLTAAGNAKIIFEPSHDFGDGGANANSGNLGSFGTNDSFTLEAVVRYTAKNQPSKVCCLMSKISGDAADPQWWWRLEGGGKTYKFNMKDEGLVNTAKTVTLANSVYDGEWHHFAFVRDAAASKIYLYIDYVQVGSNNDVTTSDIGVGGRFCIGNFDGVDSRDMIGSMDMARVSDVALSPSEFLPMLEVLPIKPGNPSPANCGFDVATASVDLSWDTIEALDPNFTLGSQSVTVASDALMSNIVQTYSSVTGNSVTLTGLDESRSYYWRVDTVGTHDIGGAITREGDIWSFYTVEKPGDVAGYWKFDDVTPGTIMLDGDKILDSSGNNRDLYLLNELEDVSPSSYDTSNPAYGSGGSYLGLSDAQMMLLSGYDFGGSTLAGSPIVIPTGEDFSIEAVVRFDAAEHDNYNAIIAFTPKHPDLTDWYGYDLPQYWFRTETDGKLRFWTLDAGANTGWVAGSTDIYDGQWHHVAAVRDKTAGTVSVYIDGVLDGSSMDETTTDISPNGYMVIGGFNGYTSRNFGGNLDFVKVTRAALTPAEFEQSVALPTAPSPVSGATGIPTTYVLSWTPVAGATITTQTVVLSSDPFMVNVVDTIVADSGVNSVPVSGLDIETIYYWRVDTDGSDAGGSFSRQGYIWNFRTPICVLEMAEGDINEDCSIDLLDFAIMSANWLRSEYE